MPGTEGNIQPTQLTRLKPSTVGSSAPSMMRRKNLNLKQLRRFEVTSSRETKLIRRSRFQKLKQISVHFFSGRNRSFQPMSMCPSRKQWKESNSVDEAFHHREKQGYTHFNAPHWLFSRDGWVKSKILTDTSSQNGSHMWTSASKSGGRCARDCTIDGRLVIITESKLPKKRRLPTTDGWRQSMKSVHLVRVNTLVIITQ